MLRDARRAFSVDSTAFVRVWTQWKTCFRVAADTCERCRIVWRYLNLGIRNVDVSSVLHWLCRFPKDIRGFSSVTGVVSDAPVGNQVFCAHTG